jgi:Tol biopolymer transport system component
MIGQIVAHYRIVQPLGKGGMGEVFVAEDTKLHRKVALKVLPADVAIDPERRQRFEREAQAIAALNHPHIVTIHSVEQSGDTHFLTMELVEGQTLAEIIPRHGLPLDRILKVAIPLADAVAAAHQKGITHRDLKPANVMVTGDGRVKVLDFGLAKLKEEQGTAAGLGSLATGALTGEGKIIGTVAYMSPEQAEGKPVDHRSDIFSLGVILYEMATGTRPFAGETSVSLISSIIKDTPRSATELNPALPRDLARIIRHALAKDPTRRYQTALDLRNELEELKQELDSGILNAAAAPTPVLQRRRVAPIAAGSAIVAVALAAGYVIGGQRQTRPASEAPPVFSASQLTLQPGAEEQVSLSPDGKWFAYVSDASGNPDIYLQSVGAQTAINLTKDTPQADAEPAFSPDGEHIAFRSEREGGGLFVMGRTGDSVRRVTDQGFNPAWSPDGRRIVYATESVSAGPLARSTTSQLWVVTVETGERQRLFDGDAVHPHWSPRGNRIAYWGLPPGSGQRDLWTLPAAGGQPVRVTDDAPLDWNPVWAPDGRHLYFLSDRGGSMNLWRIAIDEASGRARGTPQAVTTPAGAIAFLSFSADGRRLGYVAMAHAQNVASIGFDAGRGAVVGPAVPVTSGSRGWQFGAVSPDGQLVSLAAMRPPQEDIFVIRADGTGLRQITNDAANDRNPSWSPDGRQLAFYSNRSGTYAIWLVNRDGSGLRKLSGATKGIVLYPTWSPDGSRMMITELLMAHATARVLLFAVRKPWDEQKPEELPVDAAVRDFVGWSWSPDGRQIAGSSNQSNGIWVYSMDTRTHTRVAAGGRFPIWLKDSRRLLYVHEGRVFLVDAATRATRVVYKPPEGVIYAVDVNAANDRLYPVHIVRNSDVWLLTMGQP